MSDAIAFGISEADRSQRTMKVDCQARHPFAATHNEGMKIFNLQPTPTPSGNATRTTF